MPILGDLPFVGAAFSSKSFSEVEQEIVILVTPHLVDPQDCSQVTRCLPGQETRRPDDFELFLEGILEAPRGPRQVFQDRHYVPAFKNGPTNELFPCAGGNCGAGQGTANGCGPRGCTTPKGAPVPPAPPGQAPAPRPMSPAAEIAPEPMTPDGAPGEAEPRALPTVLPPGEEPK